MTVQLYLGYEAGRNRCSLMTDYCVVNKGITAVPDPYYSGQDAFDKVGEIALF
jgi:hypothetical protein